MVKVANNFGCEAASKVIVLTRNATPKITNFNFGETRFCEGGNTTFSVTNNTSYLYQWKKGTANIEDANSYQYKAFSSGNYWLLVTDKTSYCTNSTDSVEVVVDENPIILSIKEAGNDTVFCPGTPVKLMVTTNDNEKYDYKWYNSEIELTWATDWYYQGELPAEKYYVEVISGKCTVESRKLELKNKPAPLKPAIYARGPNVWYLACGNTTAAGYRWYYNNSLIEGATTYKYVANQNLGDYYVEINEGGECWTISDIINIPSGEITSGISELFSDAVEVFPNPSSGLFNISLGTMLLGLVDVQITDALGQLVDHSEYLDIESFMVNLDDFKKGIYLCRIKHENNGVMKKLIKE